MSIRAEVELVRAGECLRFQPKQVEGVSVRILRGDCLQVLKTLGDESVHCCVTSPPYWGLRDYGVAGQLGLESSPQEYVERMVMVFREVKRVLRDDGTLWLNLGDSYNGSQQTGGVNSISGRGASQPHGGIFKDAPGLKPKDLCGIPWRVAFALQADGWYLRQDIIWAKPNPMPESVRDRCTKAHEYIFLLAKSERYYYDQGAILEPVALSSVERLSQPTLTDQAGSDRVPGKTNGPMKAVSRKDRGGTDGYVDLGMRSGRAGDPENGERNKRSVWTVTTQPFKEAHFATFPPALIEPCIKAGCPEKCCAKCRAPHVREVERQSLSRDELPPDHPHYRPGRYTRKAGGNDEYANGGGQRIAFSTTTGWVPSCSCDAGIANGAVLDPFGGAGTTGLVADRMQRNAVLIELNPEYAAMAERRIRGDAPLFAEVA